MEVTKHRVPKKRVHTLTEEPTGLICQHPGEETWHMHVRKLPKPRKRTICEDQREQCLVPGMLPVPTDQATKNTPNPWASDRGLQSGK